MRLRVVHVRLHSTATLTLTKHFIAPPLTSPVKSTTTLPCAKFLYDCCEELQPHPFEFWFRNARVLETGECSGCVGSLEVAAVWLRYRTRNEAGFRDGLSNCRLGLASGDRRAVLLGRQTFSLLPFAPRLCEPSVDMSSMSTLSLVAVRAHESQDPITARKQTDEE